MRDNHGCRRACSQMITQRGGLTLQPQLCYWLPHCVALLLSQPEHQALERSCQFTHKQAAYSHINVATGNNEASRRHAISQFQRVAFNLSVN
jgi:hypothetical protein